MARPTRSTADQPASKPAPVGWVGALLATLLIQATTSFLSRLIPTLAPTMTAEFGWSATAIGYMASLNTLGSILFLLGGAPLIRRTGPIRALQIGVGLGVAGLGAVALPFGAAPFLGALLIGFGYGPSTPAGSGVLQRYAPPRHRNLIFSIKQAGVPVGGMVAGLVLPPIAEWAGWRAALVVAAAAAVGTIVAVERLRAPIDADRDRGLRLRPQVFLSLENLRGPLAALRETPALKKVAFVGACLGIGQGAWFAFLVTYLVAKIGLTLTEAGLVFAIMQASGIFGRILLGWVSDRMGSGVATLRLVALSSGATSLVLALTDESWSLGALSLLAATAGITVSSWNGVQIAEVARLAPPGRVAETAAGSTILIFIGYVVGPAAFAALVAATGRFDLAFGGVAVATVLAIFGLLGPSQEGRTG